MSISTPSPSHFAMKSSSSYNLEARTGEAFVSPKCFHKEKRRNKEMLYILSLVVVLENRTLRHIWSTCSGCGCYGECSADLEPSYGHMGGTFGYIDQHSELYCIMLRRHAGPLEFNGEVLDLASSLTSLWLTGTCGEEWWHQKKGKRVILVTWWKSLYELMTTQSSGEKF